MLHDMYPSSRDRPTSSNRERGNVLSTTSNGQASNSRYGHSQLTEKQKHNLRLMFPCRNPVAPSMSKLEQRVISFRNFSNWRNGSVDEQSLAEAGFLYLNEQDRTRCFYCGGGFYSWEVYNDPWEEHAKWFPSCEFVLRCKGSDFVNSVVEKYPNLDRPILKTPTFSLSQLQSEAKSPQNLMESDIARKVLGMGFKERVVEVVMKRRIEEHGSPFQTAEDLIEAILVNDQETTAQLQKENEENVSSSEAKDFSKNRSSKVPPDMKVLMIEKLEKKVEELEDQNLCKVCLEKTMDVTFSPCNHLCCCQTCASAIGNCPICRVAVEKTIRIYRA